MCKGNKIMDTDLIKAKKFISDSGYGSGTNFTTNLVAVLMADYHEEMQIKYLEFSMKTILAEQHRNTRHDVIELLLDKANAADNPLLSMMVGDLSYEVMNLKQRSPIENTEK